MADELKSAKEYKKDLEAQVKEVNARIEELDRALSDAMAESELEKFTRNGSTFYLNSRLFASPRAERKEEMFAALIAHSRVGGEDGPVCRFVFSALQQIAGRQIWHVLYKCFFCLLHEFTSVSKETLFIHAGAQAL